MKIQKDCTLVGGNGRKSRVFSSPSPTGGGKEICHQGDGNVIHPFWVARRKNEWEDRSGTNYDV